MRRLPAMLSLLLPCTPAFSHSASDAYLTMSLPPGAASAPVALLGEWDIALRDLDFVLQLDADGDGQVTWGETRRQQQAIERYAYRELKFKDQSGTACSIKPLRMQIAGHADGAYAALFFSVNCAGVPTTLALEYSLFFAIDPSHRGIFVYGAGDAASSALFSPQSAEIKLTVKR